MNKSATFRWLIEYAVDHNWIDVRSDPEVIEKAAENARKSNNSELIEFLDGAATILEPTSDQIAEQIAKLESKDRQKEIVHSSRHLRNALAHDDGYLAPTSISSLKNIVNIINQLLQK